MNIKSLFGLSLLAAAITACDGGGVTLAPSNNVENSNNTTNNGGDNGDSGSTENPCASYTVSGQVIQGAFSGGNCTYSNTFVSDTRPLTEDLVINALENDGLHIFEDSLFVGEDVNANSVAQGVRIPKMVKVLL